MGVWAAWHSRTHFGRAGSLENGSGLSTRPLALLTLGTGVIWVSFQVPLGYPNGLNLHVVSSLFLLVLIALHTWMRHKPLPQAELKSRRNLLSAVWVSGVGVGAFWSQQQLGRQLELQGADRRFTGSREAKGPLPVTMWMFDSVPAIDVTVWKLVISGEVQTPLHFSWNAWQQLPVVTEKAVLDCTGGWFKEDWWEGVSIAYLLDMAGTTSSGRWASFRAQSGYRWSLSLEEARKATLAWKLNRELLSPAHGFPVRLVAPGHRGFQWVKWVTEVRVLSEADLGQWGAIFTSGLQS